MTIFEKCLVKSLVNCKKIKNLLSPSCPSPSPYPFDDDYSSEDACICDEEIPSIPVLFPRFISDEDQDVNPEDQDVNPEDQDVNPEVNDKDPRFKNY